MSRLREYLELHRSFSEQKKFSPGSYRTRVTRDSATFWTDVLNRPVSVVEAPANFGKTWELREQAKKQLKAHVPAVFLPLRQVAESGGSLKRALKPTQKEEVRRLRRRVSASVTVFLDSLDEVSEANAEDLVGLVESVVAQAEDMWGQVRWVISTRPAVMSLDLWREFERIFSKLKKVRAEPATPPSEDDILQDSAFPSTQTVAEEMREVAYFHMRPLHERQALKYLSGSLSDADARKLLQVASERGLRGFTSSPGGLDILTHIDLLGRAPQSLTEVFERVSNQIQIERTGDRVLKDLDSRTRELLTEASQSLAAATLLCEKANIELSRSFVSKEGGALSAQQIVPKELTAKGIQRLLNSQLFVDSEFNQVKLYPDELVPYLAAKWLARNITSADDAHRLARRLFWAASTGERGSNKKLLPLRFVESTRTCAVTVEYIESSRV